MQTLMSFSCAVASVAASLRAWRCACSERCADSSALARAFSAASIASCSLGSQLAWSAGPASARDTAAQNQKRAREARSPCKEALGCKKLRQPLTKILQTV